MLIVVVVMNQLEDFTLARPNAKPVRGFVLSRLIEADCLTKQVNTHRQPNGSIGSLEFLDLKEKLAKQKNGPFWMVRAAYWWGNFFLSSGMIAAGTNFSNCSSLAVGVSCLISVLET